MSEIHIEQLYIYPVKSLRGIAVNNWPVTPQGLLYDRQWMLVMPNGRFVSQRQLPQMALIDTALEDGSLLLSRDGHGQVSLPLSPSAEGLVRPAAVWDDNCIVTEASAEASAWLTQVLQAPRPLTLVQLAPGHQRLQSQPERFGADTHTQFADAAPFLVAASSSLAALNQTLQQRQLAAVDMRRFRPNIVLSGLQPFEEHQLSQLRHGDGSRLWLRDHCERCIITTIDPDTAVKDPRREPYPTLASINAMPGKPRAAAFGVNATVEGLAAECRWQAGDALKPLTAD
ncbi:MOSC domain-containing protein [Pseudomaricurvus sp. HS19]|uniref:MOSC domain-containing protein n=1 Tax=Pseudomaricurvus sp. HS19 TaxID=2692626 RepID=UPI00136A6F5B|nr:MOSC N-terminal beta barrel domain-containing protein [Pseudomaricurvus sp. HS19]MYM63135.1 MOSC domain-containing protein [Pseudomaricurvus sp. HS19]